MNALDARSAQPHLGGMRVARPPRPPLRPFVATLWAMDGAGPPSPAALERVLPTGAAHLVLRLGETPLRLVDLAHADALTSVGCAVVGGPRSRSYVRDVSQSVRSVGAQLRPGALSLLFGVPADALAERHTPLADLWGRAAEQARERVAEAGSLDAQLDAFEAILAARLPRVRGIHPAVAAALAALEDDDAQSRVADVVARSGYSHRGFLDLFVAAVGLTPKRFQRVRRLQRALPALLAPGGSLARAAAEAGYADQPHMNRDFAALAGIAPGRYGALAPASPNHVPIPSLPGERRLVTAPPCSRFSFVQDRSGAKSQSQRER